MLHYFLRLHIHTALDLMFCFSGGCDCNFYQHFRTLYIGVMVYMLKNPLVLRFRFDRRFCEAWKGVRGPVQHRYTGRFNL